MLKQSIRITSNLGSLIDSINFEDVKNIACEIFKDEYFTLSVVKPIEKGEENVD